MAELEDNAMNFFSQSYGPRLLKFLCNTVNDIDILTWHCIVDMADMMMCFLVD